jgi:branched-chain amino acid transport system ATP-binding protein
VKVVFLLEIKDLRVRYDSVEAVRGISVNLEKGNLVSIIGANGAGKSTILRTLSGLKRLSSGQIWFDGQRIDKIPAHRIVKVGIAQVLEGRRVFPQMSVLENLRAGAYLIAKQSEVSLLLDNVFQHFPKLRERQRQLAGSLSGGEQQMLAIGRALMNKPKLLMMDEPSLGLSPLMVQEIGHIIKSMKEGGRTILLVEQNANLALMLADRTYVLELGRVLLEGKSKDIINNKLVRTAYLGMA